MSRGKKIKSQVTKKNGNAESWDVGWLKHKTINQETGNLEFLLFFYQNLTSFAQNFTKAINNLLLLFGTS